MALTVENIIATKNEWLDWLDLRDFMTNHQYSTSHMLVYIYPFKNDKLEIGGSVAIFIDVHFDEFKEEHELSYAIGSEVNEMCNIHEHIPFGQEEQLISVFKIICYEVMNGLGTTY